MQDTISSFTSRKIAACKLRKQAYDQRGPDITFKSTRITNPKAITLDELDLSDRPQSNAFRKNFMRRQPLTVRDSTYDDASDYLTKTLYKTVTTESKNAMQFNPKNNFSQSYAKSGQFSSSFNQMMYQDNSLMAASRQKQRLIQGYRMKQIKAQKEIDKLTSIKTRREIADFYL